MTKIITLFLLFAILLSCKTDKKQADFYSKKTPLQSKSYKRGEIVYKNKCITCHLIDGKGIEKVFPPLANSDYLRNNQTESIKSIKYGMSGEITVNGVKYNGVMQPMGLSDKEVADVMNYLNKAWGNSIDNVITPQMVSKIK